MYLSVPISMLYSVDIQRRGVMDVVGGGSSIYRVTVLYILWYQHAVSNQGG